MNASGPRVSGLDIPFLDMDPVLHEIIPAQDSYPELDTLEGGALIADRYRVLRKIGEGGMGVLYACEDTVLARQVAVKLIQRKIAADPLLSERLLREARLAAQLRQHVAQVFDCGTLETGEPYIVMELLHGRDLYFILKQSGPLSPEQLISFMLELCVGLSEAHEKGIIHRDLKPENLFMDVQPDGTTTLKIVDFGVSKQLTSRRFRSQTNPTESVGSPQYMSPEQITTPSQVDPRTDIWSLGVVMFELLTGSAPFNGAGPAQVCAAVLTQPVAPFSDYRADVPPALEAIVLRCLERDRERRFDTVGELAAALGALSVVEDGSAEPLERFSTSHLPTPGRARRWVSGLCAVTVVGACAGVLALAVREGRIRIPSSLDLSRLPAAISAWHVPFLTPTPAPTEPAPNAPLGPAPSPSMASEPRAVAPNAPFVPARPLTNVQVRTSVPAVAAIRHEARPAPEPTPIQEQPNSNVSVDSAPSTDEPVSPASSPERAKANGSAEPEAQ